MRVEYNKLVRDKIPEIIEKDGRRCEVVEMDAAEYQRLLLAKLIEEAQEAAEAKDKTALIRELADLYEVIDAVVSSFNLTKDEILAQQMRRRAERGGFAKKLKLLWTE